MMSSVLTETPRRTKSGKSRRKNLERPSVVFIDPLQTKEQKKKAAIKLLRKRACKLLTALQSDLMACDALWTLFISAALSYRYETTLWPFPPEFIYDTPKKSIEKLLSVINDTPKFPVLLVYLTEKQYHNLKKKVIELVHWVIIGKYGVPRFHTVRTEEKPYLIDLWRKSNLLHSDDVMPAEIFEMRYAKPRQRMPRPTLASLSDENQDSSPDLRSEHGHWNDTIEYFMDDDSEQQEDEKVDQYDDPNVKRELAYYGDHLDMFYSLLGQGMGKYPLDECKNGDHLMLFKKLTTAQQMSPYGAGWGGSNCGPLISCVAICEFIDSVHCERIHIHEDDVDDGEQFIVRKPRGIRIRYLLFSSKNLPPLRPVVEFSLNGRERNRSIDQPSTKRTYSWKPRKETSIILLWYLLVLIFFALWNTQVGKRCFLHLLRKLSLGCRYGKSLLGIDMWD